MLQNKYMNTDQQNNTNSREGLQLHPEQTSTGTITASCYRVLMHMTIRRQGVVTVNAQSEDEALAIASGMYPEEIPQWEDWDSYVETVLAFHDERGGSDE